jgi:CRP-like cAMP-binding protein
MRGDFFGEISFFLNSERTVGAICAEFSKIYKISRSSFLKNLKKYKKDFELFNMLLKDKMLF